jgi:hypothetical protein
MGNSLATLFHNTPFPANTGATQVVRKISRTPPAYGPSKMPHKQTPKKNPPRDAMGRTVVEDGTGRLRAGWPQTHAGVCSVGMNADFLFSIMLYRTEKLNDFIKKQKSLAFCIIDAHMVVILYNVPYQEVCEKKPDKCNDLKGVAENLPPSENRLSESQLQEVVMRLKHAYLDYGVGALIMEEDKFVYQVMVPNEKEYTLHKEEYDAREAALKAACETRHAGSKRTRSGKKFDVGAPAQKKRKEK